MLRWATVNGRKTSMTVVWSDWLKLTFIEISKLCKNMNFVLMAHTWCCICDMRSGTFLVVSVGTTVNPRGPRRPVPYVSHAALTGSMDIPKSVPCNNSTTKSYCDLCKYRSMLWWQRHMLCHNVYFWHLVWYDSKLDLCFEGIKGNSGSGHITIA